MKRYPWYSVDSSSWVQIARTGNMMILPEGKVVAVSRDSPNRKVDGQHIDTFTEPQKEALEKYFESCGVDVKRMRETYLSRWAYNVWAFDQLGTSHIKKDFRFKQYQAELF